MIQKILRSARADSIPEDHSGLWFVKKRTIDKPMPSTHKGRSVICPAGTYTYLCRVTMWALNKKDSAEIVMEDTPFELRTHLDFMMRAHGKVLVTGLGLGCAIRGLLANPNVEEVICIERSKDVLKLVKPHMPVDRLEIIEADALEWTQDCDEKFDFAWHDLWTNYDRKEPHIDCWHMKLFAYCSKKVKIQGAWSFPREFRRALREKGVSII